MKLQLAVVAFAAAQLNAEQVDDVFSPVEDAFSPVEDAFSPVEDAFSPVEDVFSPEEAEAFKCKGDFECQVLGDEGATCNLNTGRCSCSSDAFGPYVDEKDVVHYVCYNPDLQVLVDVDFIAEFPNATCEEVKATNHTPADFAEEVNAWVASEEIVAKDPKPASYAFCLDDLVVTYSAAAVDVLPLLLLAEEAPELAEELVSAINVVDYATRLQAALLKTKAGSTILAEAAARSAGVLAEDLVVDLKVQATGTNNGTCEIENAKDVVSVFTASGRELCFVTACNPGFNVGGDFLTCIAPEPRALAGDDDLSGGAIAGIVIGVIAFIALIVVAVTLAGKSDKAAETPNEPIDEAPKAEAKAEEV